MLVQIYPEITLLENSSFSSNFFHSGYYVTGTLALFYDRVCSLSDLRIVGACDILVYRIRHQIM